MRGENFKRLKEAQKQVKLVLSDFHEGNESLFGEEWDCLKSAGYYLSELLEAEEG